MRKSVKQHELNEEFEMKEFENNGIKEFTLMAEFYNKFVFPKTPDGIIDEEEFENEFLIELTEERKLYFISKYKKYYHG
ncbi:MAG: hypothetical protein QM751_08565 [Paludibacteraceae bacterium]